MKSKIIEILKKYKDISGFDDLEKEEFEMMVEELESVGETSFHMGADSFRRFLVNKEFFPKEIIENAWFNHYRKSFDSQFKGTTPKDLTFLEGKIYEK